MAVGMLTTEERWGLEHAGEPRPFPKEDTQQLTKLSKTPLLCFSIKRDEVKQFRGDQRCIKAAMTNSLSPDIAAMLTDPIHGIAKLEPCASLKSNWAWKDWILILEIRGCEV